MVELEPNSCRICLTMTEISARESLYLDDGLLSDSGLLYEQVLSLPIADEENRLKYICNYCKLQLKSFKDFKARAWEVHLMLCDINDDIPDEYDIENYPEVEYMENIKTEVIEDVKENDVDFVSESETLVEIKEDTEEQVEDVQYFYEENTVEEGDEVQDEEYLIEADHIETQYNSSNKGKINMFSCSSCDDTFKLKTHLIQHRKKTHPKTKKFSCPLCSKITFSKEALDVHLNVHNGLPAYQCEICGKTFKQKAHYNYHMLNHRNERNIVCEVCSKAFISKSDLKIHMRAHTDERRYKCDICEKTFRAHTHMVNHRYSHFEKQFECPACFQKYVSPNTLRTHFKAVHMGEVPYECEICEKKFKRKHHLHAHYKTHNKIMAIQNETEESDFVEIQNEQ